MKKILVVKPNNAKGSHIIDGLASCCSQDFNVVSKNLKEIDKDLMDKFRPDIILGYGYSFLVDETCKEVIKKSSCKDFAFYFVDDPKSPQALNEKSGLYDEIKKLKAKIFICDKSFTSEFKKGIYLPLAINPKRYIVSFSGYKYPITFVGEPLGESRQKVLCDLVKVFRKKVCIFSTKDSFLQSVEEIRQKGLLDEDELETYSLCWKGFIEDEEELAEVYNSSKINLNISRNEQSGLSYRLLEILASGGFLLTENSKDIENAFEISKQLEVFKNIEDLIDKIEFYLKNLNVAQKIAQLGKFEVIENHTFSARAGNLLKNLIF